MRSFKLQSIFSMDQKKHKKIRSTRVIMTNIFMGLSVIAIVFVLMLIAMGFSFNEDGNLEQSGLLQIASSPSGATVEIDNTTQFSRTELNKMLKTGNHHIKISKSGYDTWEKDLHIDAGLLTRIEWVRLFPVDPKTTKPLTFSSPRVVSVTPDRKRLLYIETDTNKISLVDLQSSTTTLKTVSLSAALTTDGETAKSGSLSVKAWDSTNSKLLLKWFHNDQTSWHLVDLNDAAKSQNLSTEYSLNFSDILVANDSASKLWALENGNLRLLNTTNNTISNVYASHISAFANNNDAVAYLTTSETGQASLQLYKDGESSATTIADFKDSAPSNFLLAMGTYWSKDWIAYTNNSHLEILSGNYPSFEKNSSSTLSSILSRDLSFTPKLTATNASSRLFTVATDTNLMSFDFETRDYFDSSTDSTLPAINWLDDYLIYENSLNKIIIRDFDGDNRRVLITEAATLPVTISENNQYLFYFTVATDGQQTTTYSLVREELNL